MAEEKKSVSKQSKNLAAEKKEDSNPDASKKSAPKEVPKKKSICEHKVHKHLGKGEILEELVVNKRPSYRIKFENLKNNVVFKKEEIIKE